MTLLPAGRPIYLRSFQGEVLSGLYAAIVVDHTPAGLLTWSPAGSRNWFPFMPDGRLMRDTPLPEWHAGPWVWQPVPFPWATLTWYAPGSPFSVQARFADGVLKHYYVNVEDPAVAWAEGDECGLDSEDWDLDLVVAPDLTWHLKDEDDLTSRRQWPELYWVKDPDRVYGIVDEVAALIAARAFPFDGALADFAPHPAWVPIVEPAVPVFASAARHRA